jgi:hypothetical protein
LGDLLVFERSALTIEDHTIQLKGRLSEFLDDLYPNQKFQLGAIYRALVGEITIRCKPGSDPPASFDEFAKTRCIGREQFGQILTKIGVGPEPLDDLWDRAEAQLGIEQMKPLEIKAIRAAWRMHEINRRDPRQQFVRQLSEAVRVSLDKMAEQDESQSLTLRQIIDQVLSDNTVKEKSQGLFNRPYIAAIAAMEFYES